jgi:hypothetical protein
MPTYHPPTLQRTAAAGSAKRWVPIVPNDAGDFELKAGERYAALVSVSKNFTKQEIVDFLQTKHGWQVTYAWEQGEPTRGLYAMDDWLAGLAPDARENHRWIYGEGNLSRDDKFGKDSPCFAFVCTTVYHVAVAYWAAPDPGGGTGPLPPAPPPPTDTPAPKRAWWPYAAIAAVVGGFFFMMRRP